MCRITRGSSKPQRSGAGNRTDRRVSVHHDRLDLCDDPRLAPPGRVRPARVAERDAAWLEAWAGSLIFASIIRLASWVVILERRTSKAPANAAAAADAGRAAETVNGGRRGARPARLSGGVRSRVARPSPKKRIANLGESNVWLGPAPMTGLLSTFRENKSVQPLSGKRWGAVPTYGAIHS
jgi:hypothetical protein